MMSLLQKEDTNLVSTKINKNLYQGRNSGTVVTTPVTKTGTFQEDLTNPKSTAMF